jgi:ribosomal protein S18 acetylase RimI-like enzyme
MWVIERARVEDFQVLEGLVESTFVETWTGIVDDTHLQQHLADGHGRQIVAQCSECPKTDVFVVRGDTELVGYAVGRLSSDADEYSLNHYYKMDKLYLKSSVQGHGLGLRLWNTMADIARESGALGIYLTHYPLNLRASKFYARIGLRKVAETVYECGDGQYHDWVLAAIWDELDLTSDEKGVTA